MFSRFKPVPFEPYGRRRSQARIPSWLLLLSSGIVIGVMGVLLVQQNYLPPRLTASESAQLQSSFQQADAERLQLRGLLADAKKRLDDAVSQREAASRELEASRSLTDGLRNDIASLIDTLPADPRGGRVEVRTGQFAAKGLALSYEVVLTRVGEAAEPMTAVMQLVVTGGAPRGVDNTISADPVALSIGTHQIVRGSLTMPEGFKPRETTIRIFDRVDGEQLGMRVLRVR